MTPAEAIELIKKVAFSVENEIEEIKASKFITALKTAISALEKQIPKKPTPHTVEPIEAPIKIGNVNWCKGTTIYHCPNCKDFISRVYTYCHKCGQALDWSDTE